MVRKESETNDKRDREELNKYRAGEVSLRRIRENPEKRLIELMDVESMSIESKIEDIED